MQLLPDGLGAGSRGGPTRARDGHPGRYGDPENETAGERIAGERALTQPGESNSRQLGYEGPAASQGADRYDEAFAQAYQRYYTKVFAFIYSRVSNVELAKDLTAETFERAYVKGHSLREAAAYETWLFVIARNVLVGHYRRQKRESTGMDRVRDSLSLRERPADPEARAIHNERLQRVRDHLLSLPQRYQELLALKFDADLSYGEIARIMGMTEVNVRVCILRALRRLRAAVEREMKPP